MKQWTIDVNCELFEMRTREVEREDEWEDDDDGGILSWRRE